jgi:phage-related minor tail protein
MADNPKIQAEIGLNAEPAVQGFEKVKRAGKDAAQSLAESGKRASEAIGSSGDSADSAAKKIVQAEGRIEAALRRRIALEEASLKGQRAVDEARISNRGADPAKFAPYLDQLEKIRQQQDAVKNSLLNSGKSLNYVGLSANQAAAALRQVPAQFTDIVTSLQGGQAPLTVLLQQGGQLKDVFGGVGNAARALGGYIVGLVNPFTVAAAAIGAITLAYEQGAQEQREFEKTLILTGGAAGVTATQLSQAAAKIDSFSGATQGKAAEALNIFVNAGIKGADSLDRFTATAIEFERAGGGAIEAVAESFAKLGKDPLKASIALNESTNFLTKSVYEQIKALEEQGKTVEAARVAQEAYNSALQDRTPQLVQNLGLIERGWMAIKDATKGAYDAALNIGRQSNPIDDARAAFAASQSRVEKLKQLGPGVDNQRAIAAELARGEASKQVLFNLQEQEKFERKISGLKAEQSLTVKSMAEYDKIKDQYLDKQVKKEREIAQAREAAQRAGVALDDSVIAGINKKYEEKTPKAKDVTESAAYKEALRVAKLRQDLRIKESEEIEEFYRKQEEAQRKSFAEIDKQALKQAADMFSAADKIRSQADAQEDANDAYGKGKSALEKLTLAQLEKTKADLQSTDRVIPGVIDAIDQQIEAQKRLIDATRSGEALDYGKKVAEESARAFEKMQEDAKRAAESINESITDALMRGFESGKGFAENLRDTLKNMFKSLVLKPVISAVISPVTQGLSGLLGNLGGLLGGKSGGIPGLGGGGIGGVGSLLGGLTGGLGSLSAGFSGATLGAGLAGPTTIGASGLTGIGASLGSSAFAPALSALGTAMPYLGAALALYSAFKQKKTPHLGSAVTTDTLDPSGVQTLRGDYLAGNFNQQTDDALRFLTLGSTGSLNKLDKTFGGSGGYTAIAKFAADNKDASPGDANIYKMGTEVTPLLGEGYKLYTKDSEAAFKEFTADFESMTIETIKKMSNLPVYVKAEFDKLGDSATTEGIATLVDQIGVFQGQLTSMRLAIGSLGAASDEAIASIISNIGGIEQFSAAVDTYYQNFFSETERLTFATSQLSGEFARLGVAMPSSREDFKNLVESIDKTSDSGVKLYSGLLNLAGSFASIVPAAEGAREAVSSIVEAAKVEPPKVDRLPTDYGSYVRDGITYIVGNAADLQAAAATRTASALGGVTAALDDATGAWKMAADSISDEVRRIRGEMSGLGKDGESYALAQFATLTAQARAGDVNAAKLLPQASQSYLSSASDSATSLAELRSAQAATLNSLLDTQAALGMSTSSTSSVPSLTYTSPPVPPGGSVQSFDGLIAEIRALKIALESAQAIGNINTKKTADILVRVTEGGDAMLTRAAP